MQKAQVLIKEAIDAKTIIGVSYAVGRGGNLIREEAFGFATHNKDRPVEPTTIFDVGSMTRSLATTSVIMAVVAEHKIALNTQVSRFWPEFGEEGKEKITFRHLLKHASGLPPDPPYYKELIEKHPDWVGQREGNVFILDRVAGEELEYPPTYMLIQSNPAYMALGHVAELISGEPLSKLFERVITKPLGLADTSFGVSPDRKDRCAVSIKCPYRDRILLGEASDLNAWAMGGTAGHSGVFTTCGDAVRIGMALALASKHDGGILPLSTVAEFIGPKTKYKMGWDGPEWNQPICGSRFSRNSIGHTSRTGASLWIDLDDEIAVAIFAVIPPDGATPEFRALLPLIHNAIREEI